MSEPVTCDYVLAATKLDIRTCPDAKPVRSPIPIADNLWLGRPDNWGAFYKRFSGACAPPGFNHAPSMGIMNWPYAFWNEKPDAEDKYTWDRDRRLATVVALSRLVYPTSVGFEYSGRVRFDASGAISKIIPGATQGFLAYAYIDPSAQRDWLTVADAQSLAHLIESYDSVKPLQGRVWRAFWGHEYAAATEVAEIRWTLVANALESLVNTDMRGVSRQFADRCAGLARELGVPFDDNDAQLAYKLRSSLAHGEGLGTLKPSDLDLYLRMESLLRDALRKSIEDRSFACVFGSRSTIKTRFPLNSMPEISRFLGMVIAMFFADHNPPHFHVRYGSFKAVVGIDPVVLREGELPPRALALIVEWASIHQDELRANWERARSRQALSPIDPLK